VFFVSRGWFTRPVRFARIPPPLVLDREHPSQILPARAYKRTPLSLSRYRKAPVEFLSVLLAQKPVGLLHRGDLTPAQLLRQPPLPGAVTTFHTPARLRRIRRDHFNPQLLQRPSPLRHLGLIHLAPGLGRHKKVARSIPVQGAEYTLLFDHFAHCWHQSARSFLLHQWRIVDLAGGIVQQRDQIVVPSI